MRMLTLPRDARLARSRAFHSIHKEISANVSEKVGGDFLRFLMVFLIGVPDKIVSDDDELLLQVALSLDKIERSWLFINSPFQMSELREKDIIKFS